MVTFKLTRIDMTRLLYSLKGEGDLTPLQLLKLSVKNGKDHDYDELKIPSFLRSLNGGSKNQSMAFLQMKLLNLATCVS